MKRALVVLAVLSSLACNAESIVAPASDGLELTVRVDRFDMNIGSLPRFTRSLRNTSANPVTVVFASCGVLPYIKSWVGETVFPRSGPWICGGSIASDTLAPGEALTSADYLAIGSLTGVGSMPGNLIVLEPGRYVAFAEAEFLLGSIEGRRVQLRSKSILFHVPQP